MTRGGLPPPYPPQRTLGTQSRSVKQCNRTPWRPGIAPWTLKVHPGTLHGSFQGVPGSPTAHRKDANVSLRFADLQFCISSVAFRTLWRSDLSRKAIKTNVFLTILKTHCSSSFLCFSSWMGPRAPPRPLLESGLATLGSRGAPLKLGKGALGRPGPLRGLLLGCHTLIFCEKERVRANAEKINFTE